PLPFPAPNRLVWITNPVAAGEGFNGLHRQATLRDWREQNHSFEGLCGYLGTSDRMNYTLTGKGDPRRLQGLAVSGNFLQVLAVKLQRGWNVIESECLRNAPWTMILSDQCWRKLFRADPDIVGRALTINDSPWTVVGILPPDFEFASVFAPGGKETDFFRPF